MCVGLRPTNTCPWSYLLQVPGVDGVLESLELARGAVVVEDHAVAQALEQRDGVARVLVLVVHARVVPACHVAGPHVAVVVPGADHLELGRDKTGKPKGSHWGKPSVP